MILLSPFYFSGEFTDSYSSEDDDRTSPVSLRDRILANSKGFQDFRVKSLKAVSFGRKMINIAEQGGCGLLWMGVW